MSAYSELKEFLYKGEVIEAIIFGAWGWDGYSEPEPHPVPLESRGVVLTEVEAAPLMKTWNFDEGYGAPECYAVRIWTNLRVIWVTQYDGSTCLDSSPRHPIAGYLPDMPGG